ncbi:MAG: response regulator [Oscillatoriophycideae cyanobacterium NC_groundwater_1537_Pr4_S-0.65um_50_18]|nr:response regulator [Oscillatoriophycideae cyanobacterium NC_groundwater_1537_Pr4_S-0.65um_50_18]
MQLLDMTAQHEQLSVLSTSAGLVLVVDDDLGMRRILKQLLESENLQVITASNGQEALGLYNHYSPDLVLLDAVMPVMDGFACCHQLRQSCHPFPASILMITTLDDEDSVIRAFEAGAIDYVTKPINRPVLRQRVQRLIQQSRLMQQIQRMNEELDRYAQSLSVMIQEQTAELERSLEFETILKHITDRVRESLNEETILQTVVQELGCALGLVRCNLAIYDADERVFHVRYEYANSNSTYLNRTIHLNDYPGIYHQLLQGDLVQFCSLRSHFGDNPFALFAFPIRDGEVIGSIWLVSPADRILDDLEARLVKQVINQCAIALRQAKLYRTAQVQVQELERLNQVKDDFLSTVSHELRTPMSNIKMATHVLEISLNRLGILANESSSIHRYFKILQEEQQREINLINDLLDLTRLDAAIEPFNFTNVNLKIHIPRIAEAFLERMQQQQQQFILQIPQSLPFLRIDLSSLERILTELLQNACKYTPSGETITLSAQAISEAMEICISNSGVEISPVECDRIFDKFYRIFSHDPWRHSGTGLGLALVKKRVEHLGGKISVKSQSGLTQFIIQLPLSR